MAKHRTSVDQLYSRGRHHPDGRIWDEGSQRTVHHSPDMRPDASEQYCQDEADHHAANYDNDESGWVRGAGEDATAKPGFDHSPPRDKMRR